MSDRIDYTLYGNVYFIIIINFHIKCYLKFYNRNFNSRFKCWSELFNKT